MRLLSLSNTIRFTTLLNLCPGLRTDPSLGVVEQKMSDYGSNHEVQTQMFFELYTIRRVCQYPSPLNKVRISGNETKGEESESQ